MSDIVSYKLISHKLVINQTFGKLINIFLDDVWNYYYINDRSLDPINSNLIGFFLGMIVARKEAVNYHLYYNL